MPIDTTNVDASEIRAEYTPTFPNTNWSISNYYAGGANVHTGAANSTGTAIPSSGQISFSNFQGAIAFTSYAWVTSGTFTWTVPTGVTSISILGLAGGGGGVRRNNQPRGGGGAAGAMITANNVPVQAAQTIWVSVGTGGAGGNQVAGGNGGNTTVRYTNSTGTIILDAGGGTGAGTTSASVAGGLRTNGAVGASFNGGNGGAGGEGNNGATGGGGAGGYTGAGGNNGNGTTTQTAGAAGAGGAGGGSGAAGTTGALLMPAGGSVGLFGSANNGTAGGVTTADSSGGGGSYGPRAYYDGWINTGLVTTDFWSSAGYWGAGGGGSSLSTATAGGTGGRGACVITYGTGGEDWANPKFPAEIRYNNFAHAVSDPLDANAYVRFESNGNITSRETAKQSAWKIYGAADNFQIRGTIVASGGTGSSVGTYNSWLNLNSAQTFGWIVTTAGEGAMRVLFEIRKDATADELVAANIVDFSGVVLTI